MKTEEVFFFSIFHNLEVFAMTQRWNKNLKEKQTLLMTEKNFFTNFFLDKSLWFKNLLVVGKKNYVWTLK